MKKFVERLRSVQRGSDVLEESRLGRARLIDRGFPPASSCDSCMIWVLGGTLLLSTRPGYPVITAFFIWLSCFCLPFFRL